MAEAVRSLLDELRQPVADPFSLDLRVFQVVATSPASAISTDTWFQFTERDGLVEASYRGGEIAQGHIVGHRDHDRVDTAYAQTGIDGRLQTGTATMRIEKDADGHLLLTEDYTWSDGTPGRNVLRSTRRPDVL
jgi:hypothetical protein